MRKLAILAAFFTLSASAAEPRQCQNPDLLNGLVFRGNTNLQFTWNRILPAQLSGFRAPAAFSLVGTAVRWDRRLTRVAYKTELTLDLAYDVMMASLGKEWEVETRANALPAPGMPLQRMSGTLCRNGMRRYVVVEDLDGVRYASINLVDERQPRDCEAQVPNYLPRFEFQGGTSVIKGQGGNHWSDFGSATLSSSIRSDSSAAQLVETFTIQLVAQGWRREAGWTGKGSAGSTWRKMIGATPGSGTLEVTRTGEDVYDLSFSVVLREP